MRYAAHASCSPILVNNNETKCQQCDVCLAKETEEKEKEFRRKIAEEEIIIEDLKVIEKRKDD